MSDLTKLVDELADLIADKVAAKLGGSLPAKGVPPEADPPDVSDKDDPAAEEVEATPARRTRKSRKASTKAEKPEPEAEEEDIDTPTPEQLDLVKEGCEDYDLDSAKSELLDFYISQGHDKKSAATQIAESSNEEIQQAFVDYSARLLALDDDGNYDFIEEFDDHYRAERIIDGDTKVFWVKYSTTLTDDEVEEAGLGDPNAEEEVEEEKPKPKKKRTRKAKA